MVALGQQGWDGRDQGGAGGKDYKETFWGDGYVHYFDCGDAFMSLHIRKNSSNYNF